MWESHRHAAPGRDRPLEPWYVETGAERGSSRPGLPKPAQVFGAMEPVSARSGRQAVLRSEVPCCVGMDVATAPLDVASRPSGERWTVPNDPRGVTTLGEQLQARPPTRMVLAATGGLERLVTRAW